MHPILSATLSRVPTQKLKRVGKFARRHWKKILLVLVIGLPTLGLAFFILSPIQPEYVTAPSKRGDLIQTVEGVGTVISEKDLELRFAVSGIVQSVEVKEGDAITAGQVLVRQRSGSLQADVSSASADLQAARAQLRALEEGARPEDIAIAEAEVENKHAALEAARSSLQTAEKQLMISEDKLDLLRDEARLGLAGYVSSSWTTHTQRITAAQNALNALDDVFDTSIVNDAIEFQSPAQYTVFKREIEVAHTMLGHAMSTSTPLDYQDALSLLATDMDIVGKAVQATDAAYSLILGLSITPTFSQSVKETYKNTIETQRNEMQTVQKTISDATKALQDASASYASRIAGEESSLASAQGSKDRATADIVTYETSLRIQEAQLALTKAGTRKADIDTKRADVNRAYANLQRAQARFAETILTAPIPGRVTQVNLKVGEYADLSQPAVTILGLSAYRIELFSAEVDIPKVFIGMSGSILLDAYPNQPFALRVSEIDPAATIRDGVPKYRIKLDFSGIDEQSLKIGMTGDVTIVTDSRDNVISIPGRAVITNTEGKPIVRVLKDDETVEERDVTTGMETDTDIEIRSGIQEGETIIVLIKD